MAAKTRLFSEVMRNGVAVLNADSPEFSKVKSAAEKGGNSVLSYGRKGKEIRVLHLAPVEFGQVLQLEVMGERHELHLPLHGEFQVTNALAALGLVVAWMSDICISRLC